MVVGAVVVVLLSLLTGGDGGGGGGGGGGTPLPPAAPPAGPVLPRPQRGRDQATARGWGARGGQRAPKEEWVLAINVKFSFSN